MLFMGEEHGEEAPFQFFSDHIDEKIATATREGRRREFAAFAAFAGEEVPDPQDRGDVRALEAHARAATTRCARSTPSCCACAASCRGATSDDVAYDEDAPLAARRARALRLVCNFARGGGASSRRPAPPRSCSATHEARIEGDAVRLPALAGALVR